MKFPESPCCEFESVLRHRAGLHDLLRERESAFENSNSRLSILCILPLIAFPLSGHSLLLPQNHQDSPEAAHSTAGRLGVPTGVTAVGQSQSK